MKNIYNVSGLLKNMTALDACNNKLQINTINQYTHTPNACTNTRAHIHTHTHASTHQNTHTHACTHACTRMRANTHTHISTEKKISQSNRGKRLPALQKDTSF